MRTLRPGAVDCHTHLSDPRISSEVEAMLERAAAAGIGNFALAGVGPGDWKMQEKFAAGRPGVFCCFGLHPYYVASHTEAECEKALTELEARLPRSLGLGECGLDFRPEIVGEEGEAGKKRQRAFFARQLSLAAKSGKVAVLHVVRAHPEALAAIANELSRGARGLNFLVHAFNSNSETARAYLDQGAYLSVGGPLLREKNEALREAIRFTPLASLLLESDTPDQAPPSYKDRPNEPASILLVAERVAELKKLSRDEVLEAARANFARLFQKEIKG